MLESYEPRADALGLQFGAYRVQQEAVRCPAIVRRLNIGLQWGANSDYAKEKGLITPVQYAVLQQVGFFDMLSAIVCAHSMAANMAATLLCSSSQICRASLSVSSLVGEHIMLPTD